MKFRELSKDERRILWSLEREYLANVGRALKDKALLVSCNGRREVFITNKETLRVLRRLRVEPYFLGLYLGEIRSGRFFLGLEGGTLLAPGCRKRIIVDSKVEQLVLYGRDVFINSIHEAGSELKEGDKCLILNRGGEFLAIGRVERGIVKNLLDKGWYLRKGE
jgi:ribosome biogenesis protein Nip4